jgi:hypothetical protein
MEFATPVRTSVDLPEFPETEGRKSTEFMNLATNSFQSPEQSQKKAEFVSPTSRAKKFVDVSVAIEI